MVSVLAVIPARIGSTRFPGKPLAEINGKPMILWVLERAWAAKTVDRVIVATDDIRISDTVVSAGGEAFMTPSDLPSGSDRVAMVAREIHAPVVVNLQGDEPLLDPRHIDTAVAALLNTPSAAVSTLATPCASTDELTDSNAVKVLLDAAGKAVYFSRTPIPHPGDPRSIDPADYMRHIGIYVYRLESLLAFTAAERCFSENTERLEQLRLIHMGRWIQVATVSGRTQSVDSPEDIARVESIMSNT